MSRDAMRCHVMCSHVMSCHLLCPAMGWNVMSLWCDWLWGHVVWFEVVTWRCDDPKYYSVLKSATKYFSVLQSTTVYYIRPRRMKRPVQCAEQQDSSAKFTKYCPCHETWLWWLILFSNETSSTLRGASGVILQLHQVLRLPRKWWISWLIVLTYETSSTMRGATGLIRLVHHILPLPRDLTLMIDPRHVWNVQYIVRSIRSLPPTWPNSVPATKNESHGWSSSHLKRPVKCAEQQNCSAKFTKYSARHEKWISCVTHETSSTMRGATGVTLQLHQILRLPRNFEFKMSAQYPWIASANKKTIRQQSEDNPTMKSSSRPRRFGDLTRPIL